MQDDEDLCCENCFSDEILKDYIRKKGRKISECSICGAEEVFGIDPDELQELFGPVIGLYTTVTNFYPLEYLKEVDHSDSMIWNKLTEDWWIFEDTDIAETIINRMFRVDRRHGEYIDFLEDAVDIEDDWYGHVEEHSTSKSWDQFCYEIKHVNRFFPSSFNRPILEVLAKANTKILNKGSFLYRARIEKDRNPFNVSEMGSPSPESSKFGRMNPQGIAYLYLSSDLKTCVAEVRPNITDTVSIGTFEFKEDIKLVDVIDPFIGSPFKYGNDFKFIYSAKGFLKSLGNTLKLPVDPNNSYLDYLPSQYVCEFFKGLGYDGVIYRSTMSEGLNYTLFDQSKLECKVVLQASEISVRYDYKLKDN